MRADRNPFKPLFWFSMLPVSGESEDMTNLETVMGSVKVEFPNEPVEMLEIGSRVVTSKTLFLQIGRAHV